MYSMQDLEQLARLRGGTGLGEVPSESRHRRYRWRCGKGHTWEARADSIRRGTWCPRCSRDKSKCTIDEMRKLAARRNGHCLSRVYVNANSKLKWRCQEDHVFEATPGHVKNGQWCGQCGRERAGRARRLSIVAIRAIATSRGGICLSEEYTPGQKLKWRCQQGKSWQDRKSVV